MLRPASLPGVNDLCRCCACQSDIVPSETLVVDNPQPGHSRLSIVASLGSPQYTTSSCIQPPDQLAPRSSPPPPRVVADWVCLTGVWWRILSWATYVKGTVVELGMLNWLLAFPGLLVKGTVVEQGMTRCLDSLPHSCIISRLAQEGA